jgi:hypothetical protein
MPPDSVQCPEGASLWEEELWDELLAYIEEQRVIPIVGPDLLQMEVEGRKVLFDQYVATQLAAKFALPPELVPAEPTLNAVVCQLLLRRKRREALYAAISGIVARAELAIPEPLLQLAGITEFNLFVSTTFDSLLEQAIDRVRFGGMAVTESLAYAPNNVKDLERARDKLYRPTVYHLLGKLSTAPTYVISDEDLLEFVFALQSETHRPERLFDELEGSHLLILGENFSDWLARFFLRAAKQRRLSEERSVLEIVADSRTRRDASLVLFLHHFSPRTRVFHGGGAVEFVGELARRWAQRRGDRGAPRPRPIVPPAAEMPAGAAFISYAREDLASVQALKAALDEAGVSIWYDFDRLAAGDSFDHKIRENIRTCSCFVAVLSRHTEARLDSYFRREWNYALDRALGIFPGKPFLIPVVVDDTREFVTVPDRFREAHYTWLPGGQVTPDFVARLRAIVAGAPAADHPVRDPRS